MHILFLSHNFPPEVNALATRTYEHCRRWVAAGHRVTVVTCAPNYPRGVVFPGYRNSWRCEEEMAGIQVVRVGTLLAPNEGFLRRIIYFVSYMLQAVLYSVMLHNVDVVVASSPQFFAGWAGVLCKWIRRWRFVLEIRDIWPESIIAVGAMRRSLAIRFLEWLEYRMYRAADRIITVGEGYKQQLIARGAQEQLIHVVPNGVDVEARNARTPDRNLRASFQAEDKFICAYIGTVGMAHGLDVVIKAATKLPLELRQKVCFWIIGDGAEREKLEAEARRCQADNVRFFGLVTKNEVSLFLGTVDACLVHLRGTELFGTVIPSKIFETMEMNVPIVIGVRGEARDLVVNNHAGVEMTPDDPESLIAALRKIIKNPQEYQHGRSVIVKNFDRNYLAKQMLKVLVDTVLRAESRAHQKADFFRRAA